MQCRWPSEQNKCDLAVNRSHGQTLGRCFPNTHNAENCQTYKSNPTSDITLDEQMFATSDRKTTVDVPGVLVANIFRQRCIS